MGAGHLTGCIASGKGSLYVCSLFLSRGTKLRLVPGAQRGGGEWFLRLSGSLPEAPSLSPACQGLQSVVTSNDCHLVATPDLHPDSWVQGAATL